MKITSVSSLQEKVVLYCIALHVIGLWVGVVKRPRSRMEERATRIHVHVCGVLFRKRYQNYYTASLPNTVLQQIYTVTL